MGWPPPEPPGCAHRAVRCTAGQSQARLGSYLPSVHILQVKRREVWAPWGQAEGCPESSPGFSNKTNNFPTSLYRAVGMTMGKTTRQSCSQPVPSVGPCCYCGHVPVPTPVRAPFPGPCPSPAAPLHPTSHPCLDWGRQSSLLGEMKIYPIKSKGVKSVWRVNQHLFFFTDYWQERQLDGLM